MSVVGSGTLAASVSDKTETLNMMVPLAVGTDTVKMQGHVLSSIDSNGSPGPLNSVSPLSEWKTRMKWVPLFAMVRRSLSPPSVPSVSSKPNGPKSSAPEMVPLRKKSSAVASTELLEKSDEKSGVAVKISPSVSFSAIVSVGMASAWFN